VEICGVWHRHYRDLCGRDRWQTNKVRASRSLTKDVETYKLKAQNGDPIAKEELGSLYDHGLGVPQDYSEALRLYRESAEQGNTRAQYAIGAMYELGHGYSRTMPKLFTGIGKQPITAKQMHKAA